MDQNHNHNPNHNHPEPPVGTPRPEALRYSSFTHDPAGGNPAGVVLDASGLDDAAMLAIAAEVGYSETAFVTAADERARRFRVRYFSPLAEVAFCGHATVALAAAFDGPVALSAVEQAVVAFAQARAGADHAADAVAADLAVLLRLAWPQTAATGQETVDPVGLLARGLAAWAGEHTALSASAGSVDPVTGLATGEYLRRRVRELHDQCRALAIPPGRAFGAVVVRLDVDGLAASDRIGVRAGVGRRLATRFRAGETVAAPARTRMVAVMPAYGLDRAARAVAVDLAELAVLDGVGVAVGCQAFAGSAGATFRSLAGTPVGPSAGA